MNKILLSYCLCFFFYNAGLSQTVQKYGPVLHYAYTWNRFDEIMNNTAPTGFDASSATLLINGENGQGYATLILDIGDHGGRNQGINPFRFIVFQLDSATNQATYRSIEVKDPQGSVMTSSLGRTDGKAVWGRDGKLYILTYGSGKYLVEFNQNNYTATAYPVPAGLDELFMATAGPLPDSTNTKTIIYGGTFNSSQVWWFDPTVPNPKIEFIQFELDGMQNYVHGVIGKGDWLYARLINRSLAANAYRSAWAVNIKTKTKYLIFHSTKANFELKGFKDNQRANQYNIFLVLNGKSPGTIYPTPTAIPMGNLPPAGVGINCPCYNIDPKGVYWKFPSNIRNTYFKAPYYSASELTGYNPEYTINQYNENYAWDKATHQPFINPPSVGGNFICDPNLNNGKFFNFPWGLRSKFSNLPTSAYNYNFRLTGEKADFKNAIEDGNHLWLGWDSYDPMIINSNKPKTSWDGNNTLYFQFPGKALQSKQVGFFTVTGNANDLKDYDANLMGLSMTASSGDGWVNGASTLVKGEKKEGYGIMKGVATNSTNPLGYSHALLGRNNVDADDIIAMGPVFNGNRLGTHMFSGYPGSIQIYTLDTNGCTGTPTSSLICRPRNVSKMYPLEIILPDGNTQYGPETSVGARVYSPDNYLPNTNNIINYKIVSVGAAGRARQGLYSAIGIHNFQYNESTGTVIPITKPYKIIDRLNYSYMDSLTPISMTNEATSLSCIIQPKTLGLINAPYNEAKGYYKPSNSTCRSAYLRLLISTRSIIGSIKKNQIWIYNPNTDLISAAMDIPDPDLNLMPIEYLKTVGDFYMGKTTGCDASGKCVRIIFLFKVNNNAIVPGSIVKFTDPTISNITNFTVTDNVDDFRFDGKIHKVFLSYRDQVNKVRIASFDIIASNNRNKISFSSMTNYIYNDNDEIVDFAYVPKQGVSVTDLLMVGGKNLYVLKNVVPIKDYYAPPSIVGSDVVLTKSEADVFPNPFQNQITINTSSLSIANYTLKLIDNTGKELFTRKIAVDFKHSAYKMNIPTSLCKGLYLLQIVGKENSKTIKLVKE